MPLHVYYVTPASTVVRVDGAADPDAALELSADRLPGGLCHHCTEKYDLGDAEAVSITDDDGNEVWTAEPSEHLVGERIAGELSALGIDLAAVSDAAGARGESLHAILGRLARRAAGA